MFHRFANPARFLRLAAAVQPWAAGATVVLLATGLVLGLVASPADYQQGETVRIMYVHVPSAWMAIFCYSALAGTCAVALILGSRRGGILLSLLVLPLYIPVLIFGASAVDAVLGGVSAKPQLLILSGLLVAALPLCPWAGAAALRQSME